MVFSHFFDVFVHFPYYRQSFNDGDPLDSPGQSLLGSPSVLFPYGSDHGLGWRLALGVHWHWLHYLQLSGPNILLEDGVDALGVKGVVEVLVDVVLVEEVGEDLEHELAADLAVLEVADQVVVGEAGGLVLLDEGLDQGHQPDALVQDSVVLYFNTRKYLHYTQFELRTGKGP